MEEYVVGEEAGSVSVCIDSGVMDGFQAELVVDIIAMDGKASEYSAVHTLGIINVHVHWLYRLIHVLIYMYGHLQYSCFTKQTLVYNYHCGCCWHTGVMDDTGLADPMLQVVFPIGHPTQTNCIDIPITSDTELEDNHDITLDITAAGTTPFASLGTPTSTTVTIDDDESE